MAADRYKDYAERFICTMEWPSVEAPSPVVLAIDETGASIVEDAVVELATKSATLAHARRSRLSEVAAAANAAGVIALESMTYGHTDTRTGTQKVDDAISTDRGSDAAPATTVGFGRD